MTRGRIALGAVGVLVALLAVLSLAHAGPFARSGGNQCNKPISERTGGWACYEPGGR
jgi:hypothetical protein